jgi:cell division protein FtsI/penicillin-binding protein 2
VAVGSRSAPRAPQSSSRGVGERELGPARASRDHRCGQPVIDVGVEPRKTIDVGATTATLAQLLQIDGGSLTRRIAAAKPDAFVDVLTLRREDYDPVAAKLRALPGVVFRERNQQLAPTRDFARALLGTVGPVTSELVTASNGRYRAGDTAGLSGLQRQYDQQLAGTPGLEIVTAAGDQLFTTKPAPGKPVVTTIDPAIQQAADAALARTGPPAALVAVDVATGEIRAVANSPSSGLNRALLGKYAPGSTFKMISALALTQLGVKPSDIVVCPASAQAGGTIFRNYQNEQFGAVPFSVDFAKSCNTAFVGLASKLSDTKLQSTAATVGIGQKWQLGTDAFSGSVPPNTSAADKAAAAFGQGRTEVSPVAMAVAAASVARASYLPPVLVRPTGSSNKPTVAPTAVALTGATSVQNLMRLVVTEGTGSALRAVPGGPVFAKTGTAEASVGGGLISRAWMIGWQGQLAFAVLVEEGASGGTVAGPIAAKFLAAKP